jgi:AcrR family transcriptional regulator
MNKKLKNNEKWKEEKQKIIRYARDKYFKEGFFKASMDSLAADLRMSKKTIYKYFPGKEKLVEEVISDFMNSIKEKIDEIFCSKKDAVTKVAEFIELIGNIISQFSENWLKDLKIHTPDLWIKIDSFRTKKITAAISGIIEQGRAEKLFLDYPAEIIVPIFVASIRTIVNPDFLLNNKFSYNQAAKICIEILINGILTEKGKVIFYKSNRSTLWKS